MESYSNIDRPKPKYIFHLFLDFRRIRKIAKSGFCFRRDSLTDYPSAWDSLVPAGWILMKFDIWAFFDNL